MTNFNRLEVESRILRGSSLIAYKKTLQLSSIQKEVLIGTLLGDASMTRQKTQSDYNVKFEQTIRQEDYVWHLYELFQPFVGTVPKVRDIVGGGAKDRKSVWFKTYRHISFKFYYDFFYPIDTQDLTKRKKKVPKTIHKVLTPRALAYWYMDDGSWSASGHMNPCFNTQGFSYSDNRILSKALKTNFNLDTNIVRDRTYYLLYIQTQSIPRFIELIKPYIVESFYYKIKPR